MPRTRSGTDTLCVVFLLGLLSVSTGVALTNVAPSGTAAQSSTSGGGGAWRAIDGNANPDWWSGSCTHTAGQTNPWWRLTLPTVYNITAVSITNRAHVSYRLDDAVILIGNSADNNGNDNPKCADVPFIPGGLTWTFQCGGMEGLYVNINLPGPSRILTLCEVEVFGELPTSSSADGGTDPDDEETDPDDGETDSADGGTDPAHGGTETEMGAGLVLVRKKLCWSDALLYCRSAFWDLLSVRSPEEQLELQSLLSSASFPLTKHLWLGLRRYLRGDKWFWMTGEAMTYSALRTASVWQAASPCAGMETTSPYRWTDYPCDEHVYFVCLKDPQEGATQVEFFSSRQTAGDD